MKPSDHEFEKLALEQMDLLYRVACRLTRNAERASDLVQETYLRAFRSRAKFDLRDLGIRPWLIRILHNLHVTRADRDRRQPVAMEAEALDAAPAPAIASAGFTAADFEHMDERVVKALNELPQDYQVVLLLWAVEDMSYKEISQAVEIPIGTVMSRLHRARQRLSELLRQFATEEGVIRE
ncbi:MAG TPA: sigma-70 family RNA polymerase sigma factor [Humisphaera sp.]|nr:sigma-70 family RNA polymerase sigma factor [Humisphaera sp.]